MTSPVLTGVPVVAIDRICMGLPTAGATNDCAREGLISPVAYTTTGTSPSATRAVGMTLPSVCTPCVGTAANAAMASAIPTAPATDQPRRRRFGFVMTASFHFFQARNWILQRHALARLHAIAHHQLLRAAPRDLHQPLVPAAARPPNVGHRAARLLEHRPRRNQHGIPKAIDCHACGG